MKTKRKNVKYFFVSLFVVVVLIISAILYIQMNESKVVNESEPPKQDVNREKDEKVITLGLTIEKFQKIINQNILDNNLQVFNIHDNNSEKNGSFETNEFKLSKYILVHSLIDKKSNEITSSQLIILSDNTKSASINEIMLGFTVFIGSIDATLSKEERVEIIEELGLLTESVDLLNLTNSIVKNDITYSYYGSVEEGIWLTASAKKMSR